MDQTASSAPSPAQSGTLEPRPFLKWVGGKGRMLSALLARLPREYGTYFEPFLGGGALFFALRPKRAELSDLNPELVNTYAVVRDEVAELIQHLGTHKNNRRYYYRIRALDRRGDFWTFPPIERASRFIFLNKTCFNGLCRVNSEGQFNVPFGMYKNPKIVDEQNLLACAAALQGAKLTYQPYQQILSRVAKGDFVYFDPPYIPISATSSFTSYSEDGFSAQDQRELAEFCRELDRFGVKFMLTNSSAPAVFELYDGFQIEEVDSPRSVSADGKKRKPVKDALVRNYER